MRKEDHRNEETKNKLAEAFVQLSKKKSAAKISVADITAYCDLNRNTFYYHFEDIRALINWLLEQDCKEVLFGIAEGNVHVLIHACMDYIDENRAFLKNIFSSLGSVSINRALAPFTPYFETTVEKIIAVHEKQAGIALDRHYRRFLIRFFCEGIGGMMLSYIAETDDFSKDELIETLTFSLETIPLFIAKTISVSSS